MSACDQDHKNANYQLSFPSYFPVPIPSPDRNVLTNEGVALGSELFFETRLSNQENIACASCHIPKYSFSDTKRFSTGHSLIPLSRNTPALINLAWGQSFFWDGGVKNLESLSYAALISEHEMNADLSVICEKLNQDQDYKNLFYEAYQIDSISSPYIARALAQYLRSLISATSKYDSVMLDQAEFSEQESHGFDLFENACASCHIPPLFTDHLFHDNGLKHDFSEENLYASTGRFRITLDSGDLGKYKTPTLRNISKTSPYMHDGRFENLTLVLDHYRNLRHSTHSDSLLTKVGFSLKEQSQLLLFLNCLNDRDTNAMD